MMMFEDRREAGIRLGNALSDYQDAHPLVLGIPRGGVEVAFYVAQKLDAQLAVVVVRKLPMPGDPEAGFGAIAEDGSTFMFKPAVTALLPDTIRRIVEAQKLEIRRRIEAFRKGEPLPPIKGRTVILVDDGIAMGSTVRAAIPMCRKQQAGKVVVAAPVADPSIAHELSHEADDVVILQRPSGFRAVAQAYRHWYDVPDEEVIAFLEQSRHAAKSL
jgi:putative phosphoribosyl transferase